MCAAVLNSTLPPTGPQLVPEGRTGGRPSSPGAAASALELPEVGGDSDSSLCGDTTPMRRSRFDVDECAAASRRLDERPRQRQPLSSRGGCVQAARRRSPGAAAPAVATAASRRLDEGPRQRQPLSSRGGGLQAARRRSPGAAAPAVVTAASRRLDEGPRQRQPLSSRGGGVQAARRRSPGAAADEVDAGLFGGGSGPLAQPIGRLHKHASGQRRDRRRKDWSSSSRQRNWGENQQPGASSGADTHLGVPGVRRSLASVLLRQL